MADKRFDNRDRETFKKDIARSHSIQQWLIDYWVKEMAANDYHIEYENTGTDNSGRFLEQATNEPDYYISIFDKINKTECKQSVEVKTAPHYKYLNFKVESLEAIVKYNAYTLLFIGVDTKAETKKDLESSLRYASWCFFSPKTAAKILSLPSRSVKNFYGGKPCIEIKAIDFDRWFKVKPFGQPIR
jgi:hypothetical protein